MQALALGIILVGAVAWLAHRVWTSTRPLDGANGGAHGGAPCTGCMHASSCESSTDDPTENGEGCDESE